MSAGRRYWLMKCEPDAYTIEQLERDGETSWEGVRNFQARNFMREMKRGDRVLFYASNADPSGVVGVAEVSREAYPDHHAFDRRHEYFDPKSKRDTPTWFMVNVRFVERFPRIVSLETLKEAPALRRMMVVQPGRRPSVQPVTPDEFNEIVRLGRGGGN
ncbi:MAG TPA: EVE domain-containing protein [Gemmatimonadales bacterium]|nr:EVE domain-containing protein [Gemmatimonadales bacterium]